MQRLSYEVDKQRMRGQFNAKENSCL